MKPKIMMFRLQEDLKKSFTHYCIDKGIPAQKVLESYVKSLVAEYARNKKI